MKRFLPLFLILLIGFSGCRKETEEPLTGEDPEGLDNLQISPSFNWATTKVVTVRIPASMKGVFRITSGDGLLVYHKGFNEGNGSMDVRVTIPTAVTTLAANGRTFPAGDGICGPGTLKSGASFPLTFGSAISFNSPNTRCPGVVALDDSRFVITYAKGDFTPCYLKVGTISGSGITFGPEYTIPGSGWAYYSTSSQIVKAGSDKILVAYKAGSGGHIGYFQVTGDSFTLLATYSAGGLVNFPSLAMIDDTHFIWAYNDEWGTAGYASSMTISGFSLILNDLISVPSIQSSMAVHGISTTKAILSGWNRSTGQVGVTILGINPGTYSLTVESETVVETNPSFTPMMTVLDATHFVFGYRDNLSGDFGYCKVGEISGSTVTLGPKTALSTRFADGFFFLKRDPSNVVLFYYEDDAGDYTSFYKVGTVSGTGIIFTAPTTLYGETGQAIAACQVGTDRIVAAMWEWPGAGTGNGWCFLSNPISADADGDGVPDVDDDYPADPARAFDNYLPAAGDGTLVFEDLWPWKGDFDFNDLVVGYRFKIVTNASNKVAEIISGFTVRATGASFHNGFGFQLPDAAGSLMTDLHVGGYDLAPGFVTLDATTHLESGQSKPVVIVFDNAHKYMVGIANTMKQKPHVATTTLTVTMTVPANTYVTDDFGLNTWNPFLISCHTRGREVHLINHVPTDLANLSLLGTRNDASKPLLGIYYQTSNKLPFALELPVVFQYPVERCAINKAYLKFNSWAVSGGVLYPDWYSNTGAGYRNVGNIYPY